MPHLVAHHWAEGPATQGREYIPTNVLIEIYFLFLNELFLNLSVYV
jgi:hypothetical protein